MMKPIRYSLAPLGLLITLALISCVVSYFILMLASDLLPLHKLISKGTQIFLILSLFPLRRYLALSWKQIGFASNAVFLKQLLAGLGLGLLTLLPVLVVLYSFGIHIIDNSQHWTIIKIFEHVFIALLLALLISFAEEPLFRGLLLIGLRKKMGITAAIIISSVYYAALHFLKSSTSVSHHDLRFSSGFKLLVEAFANWLNPEIVSAFIALFIVGLFLAIIRTYVKQSLGLCIGCHASWVWQIKISKDFFNTNYQSDYLYLVSSYDGVVGPLVSVWLFLIIVIYMSYHFFSDKFLSN